MTTEQILIKLNSMTKQSLVSLFFDITKGGDGSRLTKSVLVKTLNSRIIKDVRDSKIVSLFS